MRHAQTFLASALEKCAARPLNWVLLAPDAMGVPSISSSRSDSREFSTDHPEARGWRMAEPAGDHPAVTAWVTQRITRLWNEKRTRESLRVTPP